MYTSESFLLDLTLYFVIFPKDCVTNIPTSTVASYYLVIKGWLGMFYGFGEFACFLLGRPFRLPFSQ